MADCLQTILFIGIYATAVGIISPVELAREVSHVCVRVRHGKIFDLKIKPLIAYIYLRGRVYASC